MRSLLVATLVLWPLGALAQHNHQQHHALYQNWVNKQDKGCCNNQDCGELADDHERMTRDGIEVRIEGGVVSRPGLPLSQARQCAGLDHLACVRAAQFRRDQDVGL